MGHSHTKAESMSPEDFDKMLKSTDFSSAEVEEWYQKFKQDFPRGYMTPADFKAVYAKMFPKGDADKFCSHIFRVYDIDGDKKISFQEFITTLNVSANGTPEQKLRSAFRMYDTDRTGTATSKQLTEILTVIYKSRKDPAAKEKAKKDAATIMNQLDVNKDNKLTEEEFVRAATSCQLLLDILNG